MDGHERPDVVKYHDNVFLPTMAAFEERMTKYHGPDLKPTPPILPPGVRQIIAYFMISAAFMHLTINSLHGVLLLFQMFYLY